VLKECSKIKILLESHILPMRAVMLQFKTGHLVTKFMIG